MFSETSEMEQLNCSSDEDDKPLSKRKKKKEKNVDQDWENFESDGTEDYMNDLDNEDNLIDNEDDDGGDKDDLIEEGKEGDNDDLRKQGYEEMVNLKIVKVEKNPDGYEIQDSRRSIKNGQETKSAKTRSSKRKGERHQRDEHRQHESKHKSKCKKCGKTFNGSSALQIHLVKVHGEDITMPLNSAQLQALLLTCEFCGIEFKKAKDLLHHRKGHLQEKVYCCSVCTKEFSRKSKLEKHMKTHQKKTQESKKVKEKHKHSEKHKNSEKHKHSEKHKNSEKHKHSEKHINSEKHKHSDEHEIQTFECEICYEKFTCKCKYDDHFLTHKEEKGYKCPKCDERGEYFTSVEDFKLHIAGDNHTVQAEKHITTFHRKPRNCSLKQAAVTKFSKKSDDKKKHADGMEEEDNVEKKERHKCHSCTKTYPNAEALERHLARHEGMKFKCSECGKMFMRKESLQMHVIREGHDSGKDLTNFTKKLIPCKICGKQFLRPSLLLKHLKSHAGKTDPLFCLKCFEMFDTEEEQKEHQCNVEDKPKKSKETTEDDSKPLPEEVTKILQEKIDDTESRVDGSIEETFKRMSVDELEGLLQMMGETADNLPAHDKDDAENGEVDTEGGASEQFGIGVENDKANAAQRIRKFFINKALRMKSEKGKFKLDGKTYFKCSYCPKYFARRGVTQNHERRHTGSKPFKCETCGRGFSMAATLKNHILVHAEVKPYKCDICDKGFVQKASLVRHKFMHTGEAPPHKCDLCNKAFYRESELRKHKEKHDETIPKVLHICEQCGKSFVTKQGLKNHGMLHEPIKKFYTCHICDRKFTMAIRLKKHLLVHSDDRPYICNYCGKGFARSHYLTNHIRVHTGEKRFKCSYCGKAFTTSGQLSIHTRSHTGEKPYCCSICGKRSTDSANHIKHMRTHQDKGTGRNPANEKHRPSTYVSKVNTNVNVTNVTVNDNHNIEPVSINNTVSNTNFEESHMNTQVVQNGTNILPLTQQNIERHMTVLQSESYINMKNMRPLDNDSMLQTLHNPIQLAHNVTMPPDAHAQNRITRPSNFFTPMPPAHFTMPNTGYVDNASQFMFRYNDHRL